MRVINKRDAVKHLKELLKNSIMPTEWYEGAKSAITLLKKEPTVDAEPVRHGHWIFNPKDAIEMMFTLPKCSECGAESSDGGNYCPNCGAKMDEVEDAE